MGANDKTFATWNEIQQEMNATLAYIEKLYKQLEQAKSYRSWLIEQRPIKIKDRK